MRETTTARAARQVAAPATKPVKGTRPRCPCGSEMLPWDRSSWVCPDCTVIRPAALPEPDREYDLDELARHVGRMTGHPLLAD